MSRNFHRRCSLTLTGNSGRTITGGGPTDLRLTFSIKQWDLQSPNTMNVRVWNPGQKTVQQFQNKEFGKVEFSGGYDDNVGVLFSGDIKQFIAGHENATDTFLDLQCGDGQYAYQAARVSTSLAAGHTPQDRVDVALKAMAPFGVAKGVVNVDLSQPRYPRGIPLVGLARDVLRGVSLSAGATWSLQQSKLHIVDQRRPVDGSTVKLTAATGLIGWPRQIPDGIETVSLINPRLQPHVSIELDPSQIIAARQNIIERDPSSVRYNQELANQALGAGTYNIYYLSRQGDTRGGEWYDTAISIGNGGNLPTAQANSGYYIAQS